MKDGLILPSYNASDIREFKTDSRKWHLKRQLKLIKEKEEKEKKMLDNWLNSAHTHRSNKKLTLKLEDK